MHKTGFVLMPFLVLFSLCVSLCTFLCYKTEKEAEILLNLKDVNAQLQKERQMIETVYCLIQCADPLDQYIQIDGEEVWLDFEENLCFVSGYDLSFQIEFDPLMHRILRVEML